MKNLLWEILIPTVRNTGKPFTLRYHRVWDAKVREISGGLTIMPVAKGQWVHPNTDKQLFCERMIPVRIAAARADMEKIVAHTLKYYEQIAVCWYSVSDDFNITYRKER